MSKHFGRRFIGTRFIGTRFIGTRFIGTRFIGTRFIGARFIGTRFIGARNLGGYNHSAPVYQSGNRVDIMTGVSVDENGYWDKTDMVVLTTAYIPNNMYSGVPMFYVSNKALRNPEQKAEICAAILEIMRGSSGKIAICAKNATLFVERGSTLNLWRVVICLAILWWIVWHYHGAIYTNCAYNDV